MSTGIESVVYGAYVVTHAVGMWILLRRPQPASVKYRNIAILTASTLIFAVATVVSLLLHFSYDHELRTSARLLALHPCSEPPHSWLQLRPVCGRGAAAEGVRHHFPARPDRGDAIRGVRHTDAPRGPILGASLSKAIREYILGLKGMLRHRCIVYTWSGTDGESSSQARRRSSSLVHVRAHPVV